ncbi:RIO1 family regulatory kinase/ATPase [Thermodesulfobacteriota bacterium]
MFESIKLSDMPKLNCGILRQFSNTRPAIWVIEEDGICAVVKDFSTSGFFFRNIIGRFLVWRECRAYRRLKGLKGIPAFLGSKEGLAVFMEVIDGKDLDSLESGLSLPENFFKNLEDLVDEIHKRGLVHCDLKRAPNIILGKDGNPYIVDWSAALSETEFKFFPLNLIYKRFITDDNNAIIKLMFKFRPEAITCEEKRQYLYRSWIERIIRSIRDTVRKFLQKIA